MEASWEDLMLWRIGSKKQLSFKLCCEEIHTLGKGNPMGQNHTTKSRFLFLEAWWGRIMTLDNVHKKGVVKVAK